MKKRTIFILLTTTLVLMLAAVIVRPILAAGNPPPPPNPPGVTVDQKYDAGEANISVPSMLMDGESEQLLRQLRSNHSPSLP